MNTNAVSIVLSFHTCVIVDVVIILVLWHIYVGLKQKLVCIIIFPNIWCVFAFCTKIPSCLTISICTLLNLLHLQLVRSFHMLTVRTVQNYRPIKPMWCPARHVASISENVESNTPPSDLKIMIVSLMLIPLSLPSISLSFSLCLSSLFRMRPPPLNASHC